MALTLMQRAALRDGVTPIREGVMIETRGPKHSLFLRVTEHYDGTLYRLSQGAAGGRVLTHFVPLAPWRKKYYAGRGWGLV